MIDPGSREGVVYDPAIIAWIRDQLEPPWWRKAANCRDADPDLFFLDRGQSAAESKRICAGCPVLNVCLDWALEENVTDGIFGGMTSTERRDERRRRRLAA